MVGSERPSTGSRIWSLVSSWGDLFLEECGSAKRWGSAGQWITRLPGLRDHWPCIITGPASSPSLCLLVPWDVNKHLHAPATRLHHLEPSTLWSCERKQTLPSELLLLGISSEPWEKSPVLLGTGNEATVSRSGATLTRVYSSGFYLLDFLFVSSKIPFFSFCINNLLYSYLFLLSSN